MDYMEDYLYNIVLQADESNPLTSNSDCCYS